MATGRYVCDGDGWLYGENGKPAYVCSQCRAYSAPDHPYHCGDLHAGCPKGGHWMTATGRDYLRDLADRAEAAEAERDRLANALTDAVKKARRDALAEMVRAFGAEMIRGIAADLCAAAPQEPTP